MPADVGALFLLLLIAGFAAWIQTVAGFAFGLILMGMVGWLQIAPLAETAILVSLTSLINVVVALRGASEQIDRRLAIPIAVGLLPGILFGVWLLNHLTSNAEETLRQLLGFTLLGGGVLLMLRPTPYREPSGPLSLALFGAVGGITGGLFSVSGPPIVFHLYRQPIPLPVLRTCLLAIFGLATITRIITVTAAGQMTGNTLLTAAIVAPVVALATLAGRRFPLPLSELAIKRLAFLLVALMGIRLIL